MNLIFLTSFTAFIASSLVAGQAFPTVQTKSYHFDGRFLTGDVRVNNIAFNKQIIVNYADNNGRWVACPATYKYGPFNSAFGASDSFEVWNFYCDTQSRGAKEFYVEYTANGQKFFDNPSGPGTNYRVTASPFPTTAVTGLQDDITTYFRAAGETLRANLFKDVSPPGAPGAVIAAPRNNQNDYYYHWIRDSSLVMDVVNTFYKNANSTTENAALEKYFRDFATLSKRVQSIPGRIADAKFEVDGRAYTGPWCNPQADGPALRASVFIRFANAFLSKGGDINFVRALYNSPQSGVIKNDLEYTAVNFAREDGCDLWEEVRGLHFFTLASQRRALFEGAEFAKKMGDDGASAFYQTKAQEATALFRSTFFNSATGTVRAIKNGRLLDAAIALGAIHGNVGDGLFAPQDDRVLSSLFEFAKGFIAEFRLNQNVKTDSARLPLSLAIGRYYGDLYTGRSDPGTNVVDGSGPWFLASAAFAEVSYRAASAFLRAGSITVTPLNARLFNGEAPMGMGLSIPVGTYASNTQEFKTIINALQAYGDSYIRRNKLHGQPGFRFSEQYNRETGFEQGVPDLTWSYGSMLTAKFARDELVALSLASLSRK
ncbi:glycoside hydrolase 15 protein [Chytridiales sp. JEL 0842]|nr:glycoside hydrolase 15 protein [Chytridiales sp. JEL 0842]